MIFVQDNNQCGIYLFIFRCILFHYILILFYYFIFFFKELVSNPYFLLINRDDIVSIYGNFYSILWVLLRNCRSMHCILCTVQRNPNNLLNKQFITCSIKLSISMETIKCNINFSKTHNLWFRSKNLMRYEPD